MPKICIIGAGFAGLRAARHFEQLGIDYVILEGSDRIGGRVFPFEYKNGFLHYGAEYVNGIDNEIYGIVEKHDLLDEYESRTSDLWMLEEGTITVVDGEKVEGEILQIFRNFIKNLNESLYEESQIPLESLKSVEQNIDEHLTRFIEDMEKPKAILMGKLVKIYKNYFQTEWSSPIHELSMANFTLWNDGTDVEDSAVLNEFGFQKILEEFKSKISKERIKLNSKVVKIDYEDDQVEVLLENGEPMIFDSVLVTCSLGFLKSHHRTLFHPQLSLEKQEAIEKMGFGNNLKVFLEYEEPWWPMDTSTIMISLENVPMKDFMVFQPSSWAENILVCWVAGSGPSLIAEKSNHELKTLLDSHLKTQLKFLKVQNSTKIFRKNWINDELAMGSYSYLTPGQEGDQVIRTLGEPILGRDGRPVICFAGEHTDLKMYQTTVGAARSGLREAVRIAKEFFNM